MQAEALLKRHLPGFEMVNIEDVAAREGIDVDANMGMPSPFQFAPSRSFPPMRPGDPMPPKGFPYPPHQHHMMPPGYPMPMYGGPPGSPFPPPPPMGMQGPPPPHYNPHLHPSFQHPPMPPPPPPAHAAPQQRPSSAAGEVKGQDPQSNDLSNSQV